MEIVSSNCEDYDEYNAELEAGKLADEIIKSRREFNCCDNPEKDWWDSEQICYCKNCEGICDAI